MKVNMTNVDSWKGGGLLPPGRHVCVIDRCDEGTSSGGHPQLEIDLRSVAGAEEGGTIRDWIVVIPKTLGKVRQFLEAAQVEIPEGEFDIPVASIPGRRVAIIVRTEPDQKGEPRNRVVAYDEIGPETDVPADTNGMAAVGSGQRDDDIPF